VNDVNQRSLSANAAWGVFGNVTFAFGRILIVMLLAKNFSSASVGQLLFGLAVVTPLSFLVNMEVRPVFVTDTQNRIKPGHCLSTRLVTNIIYIAVVLLICFVGGYSWGWPKSGVILLLGLVRAAESWGDVYMGVLQKNEQMKRWAISQIIKTAMVLLAVVLVSCFTDAIIWMPAGWLAVTVVVVWFYDRVWAGRFCDLGLIWDKSAGVRLAKGAIPLGVFVMFVGLNSEVLSYFLEYHWGDQMVAYFGVLLLFVKGAAAVQNGANHSVLPRMAKYFAEDLKRFWKLLVIVLALSWLAMLGLMAAVWLKGDFILGLVTTGEYVDNSSEFFVIVMFGGCILLTGMILGDAIMAAHRYKSRMATVGLGLVVNVVICRAYIEDYSLEAAAWAVVVSAAVTTISCAIVLIWAGKSQRMSRKTGTSS